MRKVTCGSRELGVRVAENSDGVYAEARTISLPDRLMGRVVVHQEGLWVSGKGEWNVTDSAVHPEVRRCGVGTALYEEAIKAAYQQGARKVCSSDTLSEMSVGFWEKQVKKGRAVPFAGRYCLKSWSAARDLSGLRRKRRRHR